MCGAQNGMVRLTQIEIEIENACTPTENISSIMLVQKREIVIPFKFLLEFNSVYSLLLCHWRKF